MAKNLSDIVKNDYGLGSFPFVDVEQFVESQGIEFTKSGEWMKMKCILPLGHNDSKPSMFIHSKHGGANCYVCGSFSWNQLCEMMEWDVVVESVLVGIVPSSVWSDTTDRLKHLGKEVNEVVNNKPSGMKKIDKFYVGCKRHYQYCVDRKIEHLIDIFNISYTRIQDGLYNTNYVNRLIIPCHNSVGKYIWCEGRTITHQKVDRKYYRPYGIAKVKYLFNYHRVVKQHNWVIVVEGIVDAMLLWSWNLPGVCCFGATISDEQIVLLSRFDKVYVCLDNDPAGIKGWVDVKSKLLNIGVELYRVLLPKNNDVNDVGESTFKKYLLKSKKISD